MKHRFCGGKTSNDHDCQPYRASNGRHGTKFNVKKRCDLVGYALLRSKSTLHELYLEFRERFSDTYSKNDIKTALRILKGEGLIHRNSAGQYVAGLNFLNRWREMAKAATVIPVAY